MVAEITSWPPSQYTSTVPTDPTRARAIMKVRLYIALLMPMSRTRLARSENAFDSRWP